MCHNTLSSHGGVDYPVQYYIIIFYTCRYGIGDRQRESMLLWSACTTTTYCNSLSTSNASKPKWLCDTFIKDKYLNFVISSMFVRFLKLWKQDKWWLYCCCCHIQFYNTKFIHNIFILFYFYLIYGQEPFWVNMQFVQTVKYDYLNNNRK